jgi:hypothetical protein
MSDEASRRALVPAQSMGLRPTSFGDIERLANWFANSTLVPKDYQGKPENAFVAIQMGSELGLGPMQSLQNIAVIGNRPSVWGDAMLGLCRASPLCAGISERMEGAGDNRVAICVARRHGEEHPIERRFSVIDAKQAKLWGKDGTWTFYPERMLQLRARAFALRDAFPDVLRGLSSTEEVQDSWTGTTIDGTATETSPPPSPQQAPQAPAEPPPSPPSPTPTPTPAPTPSQQPPAGSGQAAGGNGTKPRRTWTDVLDAFEMATKGAATAVQVYNVLTSDDVTKAKELLKPGMAAKERYDTLVTAAMAKARQLEAQEGPPA